MKLALVGSFLLTTGAFSLSLPTVASAHEGKLDSMGCHYARNNRNYHCHEGPLAGTTFKSRGEAIRNWNRLKRAREHEKDDDGGR